MLYGIFNQEDGSYLSKQNSFTSNKEEALRTTESHAKWLLEQFMNENEYMVEIIDWH